MPGLVALVSHCDGVHVETLGNLAFDNPAPMRRDTIFRIASLSKPVTAVAAMILVEECKLRLDDAIDPWLPELANRRVLTSISARLDDVVAARRAVTLRDLLTFRMGFGSVMAPPDSTPIQKAIREQKIGGDGPPRPAQAPATDEWLRPVAVGCAVIDIERTGLGVAHVGRGQPRAFLCGHMKADVVHAGRPENSLAQKPSERLARDTRCARS
jgi:CubicO group peptidase (beta-lactamase class C family)